jgi:hypothetical protein
MEELVSRLQLDEELAMRRPIQSIVCAISWTMLIVGCTPKGSDPRVDTLPVACSEVRPITNECAIEIAKVEIAKRQGNQLYNRFTAEYGDKERNWMVTAIYEPEKPGGHAFILVSIDGRVLDYQLGR